MFRVADPGYGSEPDRQSDSDLFFHALPPLNVAGSIADPHRIDVVLQFLAAGCVDRPVLHYDHL